MRATIPTAAILCLHILVSCASPSRFDELTPADQKAIIDTRTVAIRSDLPRVATEWKVKLERVGFEVFLSNDPQPSKCDATIIIGYRGGDFSYSVSGLVVTMGSAAYSSDGRTYSYYPWMVTVDVQHAHANINFNDVVRRLYEPVIPPEDAEWYLPARAATKERILREGAGPDSKTWLKLSDVEAWLLGREWIKVAAVLGKPEVITSELLKSITTNDHTVGAEIARSVGNPSILPALRDALRNEVDSTAQARLKDAIVSLKGDLENVAVPNTLLPGRPACDRLLVGKSTKLEIINEFGVPTETSKVTRIEYGDETLEPIKIEADQLLFRSNSNEGVFWEPGSVSDEDNAWINDLANRTGSLSAFLTRSLFCMFVNDVLIEYRYVSTIKDDVRTFDQSAGRVLKAGEATYASAVALLGPPDREYLEKPDFQGGTPNYSKAKYRNLVWWQRGGKVAIEITCGNDGIVSSIEFAVSPNSSGK